MFLTLVMMAGVALPMPDAVMIMSPLASSPATKTFKPEEIKIDLKKEVARHISKEFFISRADSYTISDAIVRNAKRYNVSIELILAVAANESAFHKDDLGPVVHGEQAVGIMQIMPGTGRDIAKWLGVKEYDLHDIRTNIRFGTFYLRLMYQRYHDYSLAVRAFNCGPWVVDRVQSGKMKNYPQETVNYHIKVFGTVQVIISSMPYIISEL